MIYIKEKMLMQKLIFITALCAALFTSCKKKEEDAVDTTPPTTGSIAENLLFQSFQILELANAHMIKIGDSLAITPPEALYYTEQFLQTVPGVVEAYKFDTTHLTIVTTGGYSSTIFIDIKGSNNLSKYRGGAGSAAFSKLTSSSTGNCSNKIENKKILLYAASHNDFYSNITNEYQTRVVDAIEGGNVDVEVTTLKDNQCGIDIISTFDQYGLVILDTHGEYQGIVTGVNFTLSASQIPNSVGDFLNLLGTNIGGAQHVPLLLDKKLNIGYYFEYDSTLLNQQIWDKYKNRLAQHYTVVLTSKGVREMVPDLSGTILFANNCYSGFSANIINRNGRTQTMDPIKTAWLSRNPRSLYAYEANNDMSYQAPNDEFCKPNEDSLIQSLFYDGDSTGNAHLSNGTVTLDYPWNDWIGSLGDNGPLQFRQYASPSWCYGTCGDSLLDIRDNKYYHLVCIGDQQWFAENLNWAGAGVCYDNNSTNCNTYGRLYSLDEATGQNLSTDTSHVKGICPLGSHIPSKGECEKLINFCGGAAAAATKLRSTTGWPTPNSNTNDYDFNLLPAGNFAGSSTNSIFSLIGDGAYFWTSSKDSVQSLYYALKAYHPTLDIDYYSPPPSITWKFSCRCIKD